MLIPRYLPIALMVVALLPWGAFAPKFAPGARALYLFQNGEDTLYRIHGACEPQYVGKNVSSGCIRLHCQDVIDLHSRVQDGISVVVLASLKGHGLSPLY